MAFRTAYLRRAACLILGVAGHLFWMNATAQPLPATPWQGAAFAGDRDALAKLAAAGARTVRLYSEKNAWVLDEAHKLGLGVILGIEFGLPRHGFPLDDADALARQEEATRRLVLQYRDHPALLAWGIGNEVDLGMADPLPIWREVDRLAAIVKELDPAHPILMSVSDGEAERLRQLAACCEHIDLIGLNLYGGAVFNFAQRLQDSGLTRPLVITELGPLGQWQAGRKPWGAPVELSSRDKADFFRRALAELGKNPQIKGVFPFLWGAKQEQTSTWHGLLLADGSLTEMSDALATAWGTPPRIPAPSILGIGISADEFAPREIVSASIDTRHAPESGVRSTGWLVRAEATELGFGGDAEPVPASVGVEILTADATSVRFRAPETPGAYRLFITVRDGHGKAATANLPFRVREGG
ncbi:hypothetical protein AGMMS50225_18820 [Betaproteobacteria bacterium]|nr:hypothetical protein AGMMS50225_18820 [Betaproteobacteria bacterium]GHU19470.1 hypothetical protein AGMMS50243_11560 [Betaproteobacteria bacterium]